MKKIRKVPVPPLRKLLPVPAVALLLVAACGDRQGEAKWYEGWAERDARQERIEGGLGRAEESLAELRGDVAEVAEDLGEMRSARSDDKAALDEALAKILEGVGATADPGEDPPPGPGGDVLAADDAELLGALTKFGSAAALLTALSAFHPSPVTAFAAAAAGAFAYAEAVINPAAPYPPSLDNDPVYWMREGVARLRGLPENGEEGAPRWGEAVAEAEAAALALRGALDEYEGGGTGKKEVPEGVAVAIRGRRGAT